MAFSNSDEKIKLEVTKSNNGFIQVNLDASMSGHINVEYHATTLHKVCMAISLVTIIGYLLSMGTEKIDNHRKQTKQLSVGTEKIDNLQN